MFSSCIAFKLLTNFSGLTNNYSSQHIWYFMSYENILLGFVLELRRQHNWNTNANHNRLNLIGPTLLYVTKKEPFMPHDIACIEVRLLSKLIEVLTVYICLIGATKKKITIKMEWKAFSQLSFVFAQNLWKLIWLFVPNKY